MSVEISKDAVLEAIKSVLGTFEFEFGPATDYAGYQVDCEFAGCERQASYYISSPAYNKRYDTIYGFACPLHVTVQSLYWGYKFVEKKLDQEDCKVCESAAFACECDPIEALNGSVEQRKEEGVSYNTCRICLCDMSEHNWEAHVAEMKAESNG